VSTTTRKTTDSASRYWETQGLELPAGPKARHRIGPTVRSGKAKTENEAPKVRHKANLTWTAAILFAMITKCRPFRCSVAYWTGSEPHGRAYRCVSSNVSRLKPRPGIGTVFGDAPAQRNPNFRKLLSSGGNYSSSSVTEENNASARTHPTSARFCRAASADSATMASGCLVRSKIFRRMASEILFGLCQ